MRVVVVGAGIVGLSTAWALTGRGHAVTILTDRAVGTTTSAVAAASFKPRLVAGGPLTAALLDSSHAILSRWDQRRRSRFGVSRITHMEASVDPLVPRDYLHVMTGVRHLSSDDGDRLPPGTDHGIEYDTWFIEVRRALAALVDDLESASVRTVRRHVTTLDDPAIHQLGAEVVVNAAGMGAATLAADDGMVAVRGQVVAIDRGVSSVAASVSTDDAYVYPRAADILLGGTAERLDLGDPAARSPSVLATVTRPQETSTAAILARGGALLQWLDPTVGDPTSWAVAHVGVGLRPWRPAGIRLEVADGRATPIVHAYGHGGAGWTLAAGTAAWVVQRLDDMA